MCFPPVLPLGNEALRSHSIQIPLKSAVDSVISALVAHRGTSSVVLKALSLLHNLAVKKRNKVSRVEIVSLRHGCSQCEFQCSPSYHRLKFVRRGYNLSATATIFIAL